MEILKILDMARSSEAALVLSIAANCGLTAALVRLWRVREDEQRRLLTLLSEILREIVQLTCRLALRNGEAVEE